MKLIYSHLKNFLPDLSVPPHQLRDDLTLIGHFCNFYEKIGQETVFDLDIKINRGDCLGYYGLAKDLSVLYDLELKNANISPLQTTSAPLPIQVTTDTVTRIQALKITGLKNTSSPTWLKNFLKLHGLHSINPVVDLTNYIMLLYSIPAHAFDTHKSGDHLIWQLNPGYQEFITLDKSKLILDKSILMINNPTQALSLSFWGGQNAAIDTHSQEVILEMAIYNPTTVRQNRCLLRSQTEAATRLEKQLDPNLIPLAFSHLVNLVLDICGGQITSQLFDYYPHLKKPLKINFSPDLVFQISALKVPHTFINKTLKKINIHQGLIPTLRPDITNPEGVANEILRFWGYQNVPVNQPLSYKKVTDITPKILYTIDYLKDQLKQLGYDEVLTWPLVSKPGDHNAVRTQNSINSEYTYLRTSLIDTLKLQLDNYRRLKLPQPQFFEIGKIYFKKASKYSEKYALGLYHHNPQILKKDLETLSLKSQINNSFAQIILDDLQHPDFYQAKFSPQTSAVELNSQIITLDANLLLDKKVNPQTLLEKYKKIIGPKILWNITITDIYHDQKLGKYRYTFQVNYYNCDDKTAKKTHLSAFNLI